jgi:hypothetical protein
MIDHDGRADGNIGVKEVLTIGRLCEPPSRIVERYGSQETTDPTILHGTTRPVCQASAGGPILPGGDGFLPTGCRRLSALDDPLPEGADRAGS